MNPKKGAKSRPEIVDFPLQKIENKAPSGVWGIGSQTLSLPPG